VMPFTNASTQIPIEQMRSIRDEPRVETPLRCAKQSPRNEQVTKQNMVADPVLLPERTTFRSAGFAGRAHPSFPGSATDVSRGSLP
jgi:hypothetical protein